MPSEFFINKLTKATAVVPIRTTPSRDNQFGIHMRRKGAPIIIVNDRALIDYDPNWVKSTQTQLFIDAVGHPVYDGEEWFYITEDCSKPRPTRTLVYQGDNPKPVKRFLYFDDGMAALRDEVKRKRLEGLVGQLEGIPEFKFTKKQLEILENTILK